MNDDKPMSAWRWHWIIMLTVAAWIPIGIVLAFVGAVFLP